MSSDPSLASAGTTADQDPYSPLRQCFICLLDSTETPKNEEWVNPCPCTLEAHQSCMLRWVAEMEATGGPGRGRGRRSSTLQCPACKGTIQVFEPFDPALWLRDRVLRSYSAVTPVLLVCLVGGSTFGAMAKFGEFSVATFAGSYAAVRRWQLKGMRRPLQARWLLTAAGLEFAVVHTAKLWLLASIGPGLVIHKAFSGIDSLILPIALASSMYMAAKDSHLRRPPSYGWALTIMPAVSVCYSHAYYVLFGRFEKRLNAAIRGRDPDAPAEENPQRQGQGQEQEQGQDAQHQHEPRQQRQDENNRRGRAGNFWEAGFGRIMTLAVALMFGIGDDDAGLAGDMGEHDDDEQNDVVEAELNIELAVDDDGMIHVQFPNEAGQEPHEAHVQEIGELAMAPDAAVQNNSEMVGGDGDLPEAPNTFGFEEQEPATRDEDIVLQPAAPVFQPAPQPQAQPDQVADNAVAEQPRQRRVEGAGISTWSRIINGTVSALLMPQISFVMGEILRLTLPTRLVKQRGLRPLFLSGRWDNTQGSPMGLLQHTWGRSLVGTCLFVVLRDAMSLYLKYRRVQVIKNRTVRNFEPTLGDSVAA